MTRIRTGIARRPDGPEDANPMNRRLPAEVVSRRKGENRAHPGKAVKEEVAPSHLSTDLKQVLAMKPEGRSKWLAKAVQQAHPQDGRLSPKSIYDIIAHAKFANDLSEKVGQRMYRVLHANLSLFSTKQQKFLEKECALAKQFAVAAFAPVPGAEEEDTTAADAMEDMMARCRAFVRERQSERGERNLEGEEAEAEATEAAEAAEAAEIPPVGVPQALQAPDAKQATQDEAAELREANAETPSEQPISQAEPQKEAEGPLTRASKSRSRSRSSPSKTKAQGVSMDATAGSQEKDVKDAKDEASKIKKASKPDSKENGKGKTSEKPKSKEGKDTKDTKASDKAKKSKDEVSRDQSRETKTKNAKSSKEKAKESRRRENHKRRSSSSQSSRGRARDGSESSRSRRRNDKRRGKKSRNSSDSSSFVSRKRGRSSSSRPKRRR